MSRANDALRRTIPDAAQGGAHPSLVFDEHGAVLELIKATRSAAAIVDDLVDRYNVERSQLELDVVESLNDLLDLDLAVRAEA